MDYIAIVAFPNYKKLLGNVNRQSKERCSKEGNAIKFQS